MWAYIPIYNGEDELATNAVAGRGPSGTSNPIQIVCARLRVRRGGRRARDWNHRRNSCEQVGFD